MASVAALVRVAAALAVLAQVGVGQEVTSENGVIVLSVPFDKDVQIVRQSQGGGGEVRMSLFDLVAQADANCAAKLADYDKSLDARVQGIVEALINPASPTNVLQTTLAGLTTASSKANIEAVVDAMAGSTGLSTALANAAASPSAADVELVVNGMVTGGNLNTALTRAAASPSAADIQATVDAMVSGGSGLQAAITAAAASPSSTDIQAVVNAMAGGNLTHSITQVGALMDAVTKAHVTGGTFAVDQKRAVDQAAGMSPSVKVSGVTRSAIYPLGLVSATCSADNKYGTETNCPSNDQGNAWKGVQGTSGNVVYHAAHASDRKTYEHVFDFEQTFTTDGLQLGGFSTGFWCEDGQLGGSYCHNDNVFKVEFSVNASSNFQPVVNPRFLEHCGRLHDGCEMDFAPITARYLKLIVRSGCNGCNNVDQVSHILVWKLGQGTQLAVSSDGNLGVGTAAPEAGLHVLGNSLVDGMTTLKSDGSQPALSIVTVGRQPRSPTKVISATCTSTNDFCSEPSCPSANTNANNFLNGNEVTFRAAACSHNKRYITVLDFNEVILSDKLDILGRSTGHWCEDGQLGASRCHNDNSFQFRFSVDNINWGVPSFNTNIEGCARLHDGCTYIFQPTNVRYVELTVRSGCWGCNNYDYVRELHLYEETKQETMKVEGDGSIYLLGRKVVINGNDLQVQ